MTTATATATEDKNTNAAEMTGAEMVIAALADQGVEHIFGYPGGAVLPIYDAIFQQQKVKHVLVRHEQGAAHAAEGYARSTGKVAALLVTSGPGATNAVTGLADALMDSIPIVCITGQVPTHLIGNDAFQECDTVGITRPCTKHNYLVKDIADLPRVLHEAFYVAGSGRPGPVVVDIPKDIQFAKGTYFKPNEFPHKGYKPRLVTTVKLHGKITFAESEIIDWMYVEDGRMYGNYTTCALLKNESAAERETFKAEFGLDCNLY
jgi:acetolactate synthase-1/2/3 large subunit